MSDTLGTPPLYCPKCLQDNQSLILMTPQMNTVSVDLTTMTCPACGTICEARDAISSETINVLLWETILRLNPGALQLTILTFFKEDSFVCFDKVGK